MEYTGTTGKSYTIIEPALGKGGEGSIYSISGMSDYVIKVFKEDKRNETRHRKLLTMTAMKLSPSAMKQITWPIDVVYENGQFVGYVMPIIKNTEHLNVIYSDKYKFTLSEKITIAMNLCAAVNSVHATGQVCGDLNPNNIVVNPNTYRVTLVDTDSYHIKASSGREYRCEVGLPEYLAPEIQIKLKNNPGKTLITLPGETFTKETDLFALAIHIFALLMNGCHPFACASNKKMNIGPLSNSQSSGTLPQPIENICNGFFPFYNQKQGVTTPRYAPTFDCLPDNIQKLFISAFVNTNINNPKRPTIVEWYDALEVMQGKLKKCSKGHMYPEHNTSCPWCSIDLNWTQNQNNAVSTIKNVTIATTTSNKHYVAPQKQNKGGSYRVSKFPIGKIITMIICVVVGFLFLKSCFGGSDMPYYDDNDYVDDMISPDEYVDSDEEYFDSSDYTENSSEKTEEGDTISTTEQSDKSSLEQLKVAKIEKKTKSIEGITMNQARGISVDFINHYGNITREKQIDEYTYSATNSGITRIDINGLQSETVVGLYVYDSDGESMSSDSYCTNEEGITLKSVKAGRTYKIRVQQESGYSSYTLTIGQPKTQIDITDVTEIQDIIEYADQRNVYTFTAPRDGRYRFELSGITSGCAVAIYTYNSLGEMMSSDSYCTNGEGVTLKSLKEGETYTIEVHYVLGFTDYTLFIGIQKPIVDISGLTQVFDSIEYTDQRNVYTFIPAKDGDYRFEIEELRYGCVVEVYVFNSLGEMIGSDTSCVNGEGVTVKNLHANKTYEVQVRQYSEASSFILNIGNQKPSVNITGKMQVSDSIEYTDQRNIYFFTAPETGTYTFSISDLLNGCAVGLYAFNNLGETVDSDMCCENGEEIILKDVAAGETYEIQVRHYSGASNYKLKIE